MTKNKVSDKKKSSEKSSEDNQNKHMQLQMLDQQIKQVQQYLQTFDQQLCGIIIYENNLQLHNSVLIPDQRIYSL